MNKNDEIPRLEAEEKIKLDIDFENLNIKKRRRFPFFVILLLILLAVVGFFILKKVQDNNAAQKVTEMPLDIPTDVNWNGAFESEEIFNTCRESSVSVIADGKRCSGFVYSSDGWIVTVEGAVNEAVNGMIEVLLCDGRRFGVEAFRQNRESGLVLMKINATGLKAVSIGGHGEIFVGEELFTFCSLGGEGEGSSLFSGKVAHKQRNVEIFSDNGQSRRLKLFQIGILLTEEGVGAPLFNEKGELVGIACASNMGSEQYMIDYAFAFNNVKAVLEMMKNGKRADDMSLFDVIVE